MLVPTRRFEENQGGEQHSQNAKHVHVEHVEVDVCAHQQGPAICYVLQKDQQARESKALLLPTAFVVRL